MALQVGRDCWRCPYLLRSLPAKDSALPRSHGKPFSAHLSEQKKTFPKQPNLSDLFVLTQLGNFKLYFFFFSFQLVEVPRRNLNLASPISEATSQPQCNKRPQCSFSSKIPIFTVSLIFYESVRSKVKLNKHAFFDEKCIPSQTTHPTIAPHITSLKGNY